MPLWFFSDADVKNHIKVLTLEISLSKLSRFRYCAVYAKPLINDCTHISKVEFPIQLSACVWVFFLSETKTENGEQKMYGVPCSPIEIDTFQERVNTSVPSVIVVEEEEIEIIEEIVTNLNKTIIILIVKTFSDKKEPCIPNEKHIVKYTTEKNLMEDMDEALEKYVFSYLKRALESLRQSGKLDIIKINKLENTCS